MNADDPTRGMLMYINSKIDKEIIDVKSIFLDWQAAEIRISGSKLLFASIYRSPSGDNEEFIRLLFKLNEKAGTVKLII